MAEVEEVAKATPFLLDCQIPQVRNLDTSGEFDFSLPTMSGASAEKTQQLGLSQSVHGRITWRILFSVAYYQGWGHSNVQTGVSLCGFSMWLWFQK